MKASGLFFSLLILMGFGILMTAQRLESKNLDLEIDSLQEEIDDLLVQQRQLQLLIENEAERLSLSGVSEYGQPISLDDVIVVKLGKTSCSVESVSECDPVHPIDRLAALLFTEKVSD